MLQIPRTPQHLAKPQQETQSQLMLRPWELPIPTSAAGRELGAGISIPVGTSGDK